MLHQAIVPTGTYLLIDRNHQVPLKEILIPAIETCIAVILMTTDSIVVLHIDSPHVVEDVLPRMIAQLKDSKKPISATLIGGDFGCDLNSSDCIYDQVIDYLKKNQIKYSHQHYSLMLPKFIIPMLFFTGMIVYCLANNTTPNAVLLIVLPVLLFFGHMVNCKLEQYTLNSFNAEIDINSGNIKVVSNDKLLAAKMLTQFQSAAPAEFSLFKHRFSLDPKNAPKEKIDMIELKPTIFTRKIL